MGAAETSAKSDGDSSGWIATAFDIQGLRRHTSSHRAFRHPVIEDLARGGWPPARVGLLLQLQAPLLELWQSALQQCVASSREPGLLFAHADMLAELCGRGQPRAAYRRRYQQMLTTSGTVDELGLWPEIPGVMEHARARIVDLCSADALVGAAICGLALPWVVEAKFKRLLDQWRYACGDSAGVAGAFADALADTNVDRSRLHRAALVAQQVSRRQFERLKVGMTEALDVLALIDDQIADRLGVAGSRPNRSSD